MIALYQSIFYILAALLLVARVQAGSTDVPCHKCVFKGTDCVLLPPKDVTFPCYQGSPQSAAACFATDPLMDEDTTWECGECADFGFPQYLINDPIYKNMELWVRDKP
jgi:hypothetical protein